MNSSSLPRRRTHILLISLGVLAAVAIFYILACHGIGVPCLFYKVTGLLCPGCGNSRAAMALLELDIQGALGYNLLFPLEFLYIAWVYCCCCRQYLKTGRFTYRPPFVAADITLLILLLIWWVVRNLL